MAEKFENFKNYNSKLSLKWLSRISVVAALIHIFKEKSLRITLRPSWPKYLKNRIFALREDWEQNFKGTWANIQACSQLSCFNLRFFKKTNSQDSKEIFRERMLFIDRLINFSSTDTIFFYHKSEERFCHNSKNSF